MEIWATGASYQGWQQVLSSLLASGYEISLTENGVPVSISLDMDMFSEELDVAYCLEVLVGGQVWTTQFFSTSVIDFQGSPELIRTDEDLDAIMEFMRDIARFSHRSVIFIPETLDAEGVGRYLVIDP